MHLVDAIGPIVLVVGVGAALRAFAFLPETFFRQINRLAYWVALPCFLFRATATPHGSLEGSLRIFLVLLVGTAVAVALGFAVAGMLRVPRPSRGAFVQGAFRGNLAYVGLSVIVYGLAGGLGQATGAALEKTAVLAIAPLIPIYNAAAVLLLVIHRPLGESERGRAAAARRVVWSLVTNPIVLSVAAGLAWGILRWPLPELADRTLGTVGPMALPLALLAVGASLRLSTLRGHLFPALGAALVKVGAAPLAGLGAATFLDVHGPALQIALVLLACPTAVMSYVLAEQLGSDDQLAGAIVAVSSLLSIVPLALVLNAA